MLDEIKDIKSSLWISASAGTGKTKNLIDRILALLLQGAEPSHILCLTYTKSAAGEMLERLSKYLDQINRMPDADAISELQQLGFSSSYLKQIRKLYLESLESDWVNIKTIHSFAFDMLKKFPLETGKYPGIKLCDENRKQELLDEAFNFILNQNNPRDLKTVAKYTSSILDLVKDTVKIRKFLAKHPLRSDIKNFFVNFFEIDEQLLTLEKKEALHNIALRSFGRNYKDQFSEVISVLKNGNKDDIKKAVLLQRSIDECIEDVIHEFIPLFFNKKDKSLKHDLCSTKIKTKELETQLLDIRRKTLNYSEEKDRLLSVEANIAFFSVVNDLINKFSELKAERHLIDYDDLILDATDLLKYNWVSYKVDNSIDHILIDEAQDTNPEQWEIVELLTTEFFTNYKSEKTIFAVGDEKQSIYSFQGADVNLFQKMHSFFKKNAMQCGQKFHDISLNKSYRSDGNILSFIDRIFADDFHNIKHETVKNPRGGVVEIVDLFEVTDETREGLASYIADFIRRAMRDRVAVGMRPASPKDFLILFRHRDVDEMNAIIDCLKQMGIPVSGVDRIPLKDEIIVEDLVTLADFVCFPFNDLACACVLKSPIIGMTEEDLMKVCLSRKDEKLWSYIAKNDEIRGKYAVDLLEKYLNLQMSCADFFRYVLADGLREKFTNRLGEKCLDIANEFLTVCEQYEKTYSPNLPNFLRWFRKYEQTVKRDSYGNEDEVRIMTVHASKGLQSPFVILADAHFEPRDSDPILVSEGIEDVVVWNFDRQVTPEPVNVLLDYRQAYKKNESQRLLYVALTRAENYLCILGKRTGKTIKKDCWYNKIVGHVEDFVRDGSVLRFGNYTYIESAEEKTCSGFSESFREPLPSWYYEKIPADDTATELSMDNDFSEFGNCVHLLLKNIAVYGDKIEIMSDEILSLFKLSEKEKKEALAMSVEVFKKFPELFDEKSQSEVTVFVDGMEYRIDKIATMQNATWIIDFKTGLPKTEIPTEYLQQLQLYRKIYKSVSGIDAKTAILWTRNLRLVEIQ